MLGHAPRAPHKMGQGSRWAHGKLNLPAGGIGQQPCTARSSSLPLPVPVVPGVPWPGKASAAVQQHRYLSGTSKLVPVSAGTNRLEDLRMLFGLSEEKPYLVPRTTGSGSWWPGLPNPAVLMWVSPSLSCPLLTWRTRQSTALWDPTDPRASHARWTGRPADQRASELRACFRHCPGLSAHAKLPDARCGQSPGKCPAHSSRWSPGPHG